MEEESCLTGKIKKVRIKLIMKKYNKIKKITFVTVFLCCFFNVYEKSVTFRATINLVL